MNASRALTMLMLALLACATAGFGRAEDRSFSGLGTAAQDYAQVMPATPLVFPADHGAHSDFRIEWWYVTANLKDANGVAYGIQWTLFRQAGRPADRATGWDSRQLWMAHAAITSANMHRSAERFARGGVGQAGVVAVPFNAWIDDWQMTLRQPQKAADLSSLTVSASAKDFSYRLTMEGDRPVALQGDAGYSRKSDRGQASY